MESAFQEPHLPNKRTIRESGYEYDCTCRTCRPNAPTITPRPTNFRLVHSNSIGVHTKEASGRVFFSDPHAGFVTSAMFANLGQSFGQQICQTTRSEHETVHESETTERISIVNFGLVQNDVVIRCQMLDQVCGREATHIVRDQVGTGTRRPKVSARRERVLLDRETKRIGARVSEICLRSIGGSMKLVCRRSTFLLVGNHLNNGTTTTVTFFALHWKASSSCLARGHGTKKNLTLVGQFPHQNLLDRDKLVCCAGSSRSNP